VAGWFPRIAIESAGIGAALLVLGFLLVDVILGGRGLNSVTRWALAFPGLVAYAFVLMLAHMASGGRIFSNPWLVRGVTLASAVVLAALKFARHLPRPESPRPAILAVGGIVLLGLLVWGTPVARVVPLGVPGSDTGWHMGWTSQLLNGETTPSTLITGRVPNYYPWMFHALAAFVTSLTPGGRAYEALGPLQLVQPTAALIALFALGQYLARSWQSAGGAALFGGIGAGLAFALIRRFDRVLTTPRSGGPRGTYNASFNNLAPPLPRDVAYSLFAAFLLVLVMGLARRDHVLLVVAGITAGLIGVTSAEFFIIALGVSMVGIAFGPTKSRKPVALTAVVVPALIVYGVWLVPLIMSYRRLGGFVNTTSVRAIVLSPVAILMSWGLATPFALYGAIRWIPRARDDPGPRILLAMLLVSGAVVAGASLVPVILGEGFTIVGRAPRYWPVLYLAVAIYGGLGFGALLEWAGRASRVVAAGVLLTILALVIPLPFDVSRDYPNRVGQSPALADALLGRERNVLTALARAGRGRCVVATPALAFTAFSYTGYRLMAYEGSRGHRRNFARIRWRDIYKHIPPEDERLADLHALIQDDTGRARFVSLLQTYRVNLLVVPRDHAGAANYQGFHHLSTGPSDPYSVFLVAPCDH